MKTYLLNIPNKLKKFSQGLDVKALLCSKTWEVLNEDGFKQVFIFQNDGALLISTNGNVIKSTWQFVAANKSIIITADKQTTMLRPAFIDGVVFAMQKDGTQEYLFMIDENNKSICPNRTLTELERYFERKLAESPEALAEIRKQQELEEKAKKEMIVAEHKDEINTIVKERKRKYNRYILIDCLILVFFIILTITVGKKSALLLVCFFLADIILFVPPLLLIIIKSVVEDDVKNEIIEKYK